jgi:hypothetical protein
MTGPGGKQMIAIYGFKHSLIAQFSAIVVRAGKTDVQGQTTTGSKGLHFANAVTSDTNVMTSSGMSGVQVQLDTYGNSANEQNRVIAWY